MGLEPSLSSNHGHSWVFGFWEQLHPPTQDISVQILFCFYELEKELISLYLVHTDRFLLGSTTASPVAQLSDCPPCSNVSVPTIPPSTRTSLYATIYPQSCPSTLLSIPQSCFLPLLQTPFQFPGLCKHFLQHRSTHLKNERLESTSKREHQVCPSDIGWAQLTFSSPASFSENYIFAFTLCMNPVPLCLCGTFSFSIYQLTGIQADCISQLLSLEQ